MNVRHPFDQTPEPIVLGIEYNQDCSAFTVGTTEGFRVFDTASGKLIYEREFEGSISFATVLNRSRYVALIGGGPSPQYPANKFILWDNITQREVFKLEYNNIPLRACLTSTHYVVIFERGVILYNLSSEPSDLELSKSRTGIYETCSNPYGLCCLGNKKLAFPGRTKGQVQIVDLPSRKVSILPAHNAALRALALNASETIIATASETGTLFRLWSTIQEAKIYEVRRGVDAATIFSLAFSLNGQFLASTSDKGTVHIFELPRAEDISPPPRDNKKAAQTRARGKSASKPITVPSAARKSTPPSSSNSPGTRNYSSSPLSPSSAGKYKLGSSPTINTTLTPSDISAAQSGGHHPSAGISWNDMARQQPQPYHSRRPGSMSSIASSPEIIGANDVAGYKSPQKWGNFANLPFAPKIFMDTYSDMKTAFNMGNESIPSAAKSKGKGHVRGTTKQGGFGSSNPSSPTETMASSSTSASTVKTALPTGGMSRREEFSCWPGGRPPKGKIAWVTHKDDERLVIIGAGRDAIWEKFFVGVDENGARAIGKEGWKRYLEDEGLD